MMGARAAAWIAAVALLAAFTVWIQALPSAVVAPVLLWGVAAAVITCVAGIAVWAACDRRAERVMEDEAEEHLKPLRTGGTRIERRMRGVLRGQGRLLRSASRARHRRARAGVQTGPPPPAEPGTAHMPVPPPVTVTESEPPATITEPGPDPRLDYDPDSTTWMTAIRDLGVEVRT